jgi:hypothetical protein
MIAIKNLIRIQMQFARTNQKAICALHLFISQIENHGERENAAKTVFTPAQRNIKFKI